MKNAGSVLKDAREAKHRTIQQIAEITRIKEKFLIALENCDWKNLPEFTTTQGFARSFAVVVGANPKLVAALLRRDYPQQIKINSRQEISLHKSSVWTPKTTLLAVSSVIFLILGFYLVNQYLLFAAAPSLQINKIENKDGTIFVTGKTLPTATVEVNNRSVLVENDGTFQVEIENQDLINSQVEVTATSRTGKTTAISKKITD